MKSEIFTPVYSKKGENMKAKVNGAEVEGTPEEIAKFLGVKNNPRPAINYDDISVKHEQENICKGCPHQGEGCNPQFCL